MTKRIVSIFLLMVMIVAGCSSINPDESIPTQLSVPTSEPTSAPTQTAVATDLPLAQPTDLIVPQTVATNPNEQAYVRTINASPDLGIVDVYIEALAIGTNVNYGRYTEREGIVAGRYKLRILPTASFVTDITLYEEELTLFGGQSLIFVISGTPEAVTVTTLDEPNEPLRNDTSRLLMINALKGADNLVMLVDDTPQTSITPYLTISETTEHPAKTANFVFQNNGSTLFDTKLDLRERRNYIFLMLGDLSRPDTLEFLSLSSDAPGITMISFINATPSLDTLDVYLGDTPFVLGASYSEMSEPQQFLSGTYDISIYPDQANRDEVDPLTGTQLNANPGEEIVMILVGEPSNYRFITYRNNQQPTYTNRARITFVNAVETVPNIVLRSSDSTLENTLGYGRLSKTYDIDAEQSLSFTWINQLDDTQDIVLEDINDFTPTAGQNYLYIFSGRGYDDPIIHSLVVGTLDFAFEEVIPVTNVPTSRPTTIRLVNIWDNSQFVVRLDGTIIAEGVEFGKATNPLIIESGEHTLTFHEPETDINVLEVTDEFLVAKNYSVIAYNYINADENTPSDLQGDTLIIDDTANNGSSISGRIRLVVLEAEAESFFGIGYSAPSPNVSQPSREEGFRRSLSIGIEQVIRKINAHQASEIHSIPVGTFNLQIIDNDKIAITFTHTEYSIEPRTLYNIFLREVSETGETNTVIVPYTP